MDKESVSIPNGILFNHTKKEILLFVTTWVDLEDTENYCKVSLICGM